MNKHNFTKQNYKNIKKISKNLIRILMINNNKFQNILSFNIKRDYLNID
jgi:hypothetical protein